MSSSWPSQKVCIRCSLKNDVQVLSVGEWRALLLRERACNLFDTEWSFILRSHRLRPPNTSLSNMLITFQDSQNHHPVQYQIADTRRVGPQVQRQNQCLPSQPNHSHKHVNKQDTANANGHRCSMIRETTCRQCPNWNSSKLNHPFRLPSFGWKWKTACTHPATIAGPCLQSLYWQRSGWYQLLLSCSSASNRQAAHWKRWSACL